MTQSERIEEREQDKGREGFDTLEGGEDREPDTLEGGEDTGPDLLGGEEN